MILGFSGTQRGMTQKQAACVNYLFVELLLTVLHHGVCEGADAQAHRLAKKMLARVVGHPPIDQKKMAMALKDFDELRPPAPYLVRNRNIVAEAIGGLIAAPKDYSMPAILRGQGTWTTVGYARAARRRLWLVWPDGTFKEEAYAPDTP